MKDGNWIALHKELRYFLPHGRKYTTLEAMFSYTLDIDNGKEGTISGYSKLWGWDRKKVRRFIEELGTGAGHFRDRDGTGAEHLLLLKLNNLQDRKDANGTDEGQGRDTHGDTTINPNPNPNPNPKKNIKPITSESVDSSAWDQEDLWLYSLIKEESVFTDPQKVKLLDYRWWVDVDEILSGLNKDFLKKQFAEMRVWKKDNGNRWPTDRGIRKFVKGWLGRAKERERKQWR